VVSASELLKKKHHTPFVMQLSSASAINNGNMEIFLLSFGLDPPYGVHKP